jgi:hypothetical protein
MVAILETAERPGPRRSLQEIPTATGVSVLGFKALTVRNKPQVKRRHLNADV